MAWRFDAATDVVSSPGYTGTVATFLFWVSRVADRNSGTNPMVLHASALGAGTVVGGLGSDGSGDVLTLFDSAFTNSTGPTMVNGTWLAIGIVINGTTWDWYYGTDPAALTHIGPLTRATTTSPGSFTLSDATSWLSGDMANLKVFTRALSAAEVAAELATYNQVSATNLVIRHNLVTSSMTPATGSAFTAGSTAIAVVSGPPALDSITGALAVTLQKPTSAIPGTVTDQGALAVTLQKPVGGITGTVPDNGQLAVTLQKPIAALVGTVVDRGTLAVTLQKPTATIIGTHPAVGALGVTLQKPRMLVHDALPVLNLPLRAGDPVLAPYWGAGQPIPA